VAKGASQPERRRRRARPCLAAFRSPFAAAVAVLALIVQLVAVPYHQALIAPVATQAAADVASVAAELKATFGEAASLCVQSDNGKPSPTGDCDDHCPLCHFRVQAAALMAADPPALPTRMDLFLHAPVLMPEAGALPGRPVYRHRARGPPFAV
jgi:hypothetical protein